MVIQLAKTKLDGVSNLLRSLSAHELASACGCVTRRGGLIVNEMTSSYLLHEVEKKKKDKK